MPNWCMTTYAFTGEPEVIAQFEINLKNYTSKDYHENGFGKGWLGNVLAGYNLYPSNEEEVTFSYRGHITEAYWCSGALYVSTETAWVPMPEMWDVILDKYFQNEHGNTLIDYVFISEESGEEVYINTDTDGTFFPERFLLEVGGIPEHRDYESYYLESEQGVIELVNDIFATKIETFDEVKIFLTNKKRDTDGVLLLHEYADTL